MHSGLTQGCPLVFCSHIFYITGEIGSGQAPNEPPLKIFPQDYGRLAYMNYRNYCHLLAKKNCCNFQLGKQLKSLFPKCCLFNSTKISFNTITKNLRNSKEASLWTRRQGLSGRVQDLYPTFMPLVDVIVVIPSLVADVVLQPSLESLSGACDLRTVPHALADVSPPSLLDFFPAQSWGRGFLPALVAVMEAGGRAHEINSKKLGQFSTFQN